MEPETLIEHVQETAAENAASQIAANVTEAVHTGDSIIASEVAQVEAELSEHVEASAERHEEILEDTSWLQERTALLLTEVQALRESNLQMRETLMSIQERVSTPPPPEPTPADPNLSPGTNPTTPPTLEEPAAGPPEPASGAEDLPEAKTPQARKRRKI